ncbi:CHAD domain-containing protein [Andreprevotia lacus DSM 23236]|jgi:CHAD domain-containing protein|uniref:CHAD domain-containing protein n=1 Tax=Andreprevotia lacus DSM 23236 TaxID=1121001 RepID=A0A1W1XD31_9NEIS|nr:CHAD domain-containing protein [Andreprevotia lacus]SMC21714.1 CHAD domain-containing protein [Andreprevotia lacus DSM 23236]
MARKRQLLQQINSLLDEIDSQRSRLGSTDAADALHKLRIALRGLRTLLPLLQRKDAAQPSLRDAWRALFRLTGPARDAEVMLGALPADHVSQALQQQRVDEAYAALRTAADSITWPVLCTASRIQLAADVRDRRRKDIRKRIRRVVQRRARALCDTLHQPVDETQWHTLRVAIKRLRYLLEHTQPWQPGRVSKLLPTLKNAQSLLGDWHDLTVRQTAGLMLDGDDVLRNALASKAECAQHTLRRQLQHALA